MKVTVKSVTTSRRHTHLLLGGVVDGCEGDEAADVLSIFLENNVIPEDGNTRTVLLTHTGQRGKSRRVNRRDIGQQ